MLIDTHAHLNFNAYKEDVDKVIKRSLENNIWLINIGSQYETSKRAVEIAEKYSEGVYAAIGLHPIHLETGLIKAKIDKEEIDTSTGSVSTLSKAEGVEFKIIEETFNYEKYKQLAKSPKVIAIGEIGLDYYWRPKTKRKLELFKEKQKNVLLKQLELAKELNLPVIFHCRMAHRELSEFLFENPVLRPQKAVAHGFVGNLEELQKYLDFGYYIGFNGIIFKKIEGINFKENIKKTPLDRVLIETDCPYLTPPPFENQRNEPLYLKYVAEEIAKIKNLSFEEVAKITNENTQKLFIL